MDLKPIPKHENSVSVIYTDAWDGSLFCPFCGAGAIFVEHGELKPNVCKHMVCAEAASEFLYVSDHYVELVKSLVPDVDRESLCEKGAIAWEAIDGSSCNVSAIDFAELVPNTLSITLFYSSNGEEMTVAYSPDQIFNAEDHSD